MLLALSTVLHVNFILYQSFTLVNSWTKYSDHLAHTGYSEQLISWENHSTVYHGAHVSSDSDNLEQILMQNYAARQPRVAFKSSWYRNAPCPKFQILKNNTMISNLSAVHLVLTLHPVTTTLSVGNQSINQFSFRQLLSLASTF